MLETDVDAGETDERYYVYGNYIDEVLLMVDISDTDDYYYAHDHLYSVVAMFDDTGAVAERYEYDAYGDCHVLDADLTADADGLSDVGTPYLFTGRRLDTMDSGSLKIYYYRARAYDPQTGRFMQRDPLGIDPAGGTENSFVPIGQYKDGMNIYQYVRSVPCKYLDPSGMNLAFMGWYMKTCGLVLYCRDNYLGIPGLSGFDHCRVVPFNSEEIDTNAKDWKVIPIVRDYSPNRMTQYGTKKNQAAGKSCSCASCEDIQKCVIKANQIISRSCGDYGTGNNCQTAAARALSGCCLKANWQPSFPGTYPGCVEYKTVTRYVFTGVGYRKVVEKVCVRYIWEENAE